MKNYLYYSLSFLVVLFIFNQNTYGQDSIETSAATYFYTQSQDSASMALNIGGENNDMFLDNLLVPGDTLGSIPLDIIEINSQNKIYVYGQNQVIIVNSLTNIVEDTINLTHSIYYPSVNNYIGQAFSSEKHFAYNPNTELLYCATEGMRIIAINVVNNSWNEVVARPAELNSQWYAYQILKYDTRKNRLYWVVSKVAGNESNIFIYNANSLNLLQNLHYAMTIEDIVINDTKNEFYLSLGKEYRIYNDNDYTYTVFGSQADQTGGLLYIHTANIHKLFCFTRTYQFTSTSIYVVDFNNANNISSFPSPLPTETACYYSTNDDKIYVGFDFYQTGQHDVYILDPYNYTVVNSLNTNIYTSNIYNDVHSFNELGNKIIVSKNNEISAFDKTNQNLQLIKKGVHNVFFRAVTASGKVFVIGTWTGSLDVIDNSLNVVKSINLGEPLFFGCYNGNEHKIYFYNKHFQDNSKVYILNTLTNDINYVSVGSNVSDVLFDAVTDRAYVSTYSDETKIKVIDGKTDLLLPSSQWVQLGHGYCGKMFIAPNRKLYCVVGMDNNHGSGIEVRDAANNFALLKYQPVNITGALDGEFCYNTKYSAIYATLRDLNGYSTFGQFLEINGKTNNITTYTVAPYPYKMVCNDYNNKIYFEYIDANSTYLSVFRCDEHTFGQIQIGHEVRSLEYAPDRNAIYVLYPETKNARVGTIIDETLVSEINVPATSITLKYNPFNFNLYVYVPYYNAGKQYEQEVFELVYEDPDNDGEGSFTTMNYVSLKNKNMNRVLGTLLNNDLIIDQDSNKLYVANGGFSNISVIRCKGDQDAFVKGENWISFPRLQRQNNDPVETKSVLEKIVPLPEKLDLEGRKDQDNIAYHATKNYSHWNTSNLPSVQSTRGYILTITDPHAQFVLPYNGSRLNPTTPITIYAGYKNWVGYFLPWQQDPFDALTNVLPDLKSIKGQYWAAANMGTPSDPDWISTKPYPLHYGDMLILEPFTTTSFIWLNTLNPGDMQTFEDTQHYTYTPQGDYTPVFIEPDTTHMPVEIGAFVNDSCVGAVKVNTDDTLVLIRGYIPENSNDSLVFENYYGNKSTERHVVNTYFVYNKDSRVNEKRCIRAGEHADFYLVSFNGRRKENTIGNSNLFPVKVFPNPAGNFINVKYNLRKGSEITISLYYIEGQITAVFLANQYRGAGVHTERWKLQKSNGEKMLKGIYVLKVSSESDIVFKKLSLTGSSFNLIL